MFPQTYHFHFHLHFAHLLEERLRHRLAPFGIHPRQARILDALGRMGQASQVELAREFGLCAASMSTMASRLLAAELVERRVDEREHRCHVLSLTPLGNSLLAQIHQQWHEIDREINEFIGDENADSFAAFSLQLLKAFGGSPPGDDSLEHDTGVSPSPRTTA
ncbi:MarR family winged helix-turn-helix transcriptional regulator [Granulosicoccus sp. 3-233]|uniref:MarR family winged helix-turn-helix transcriptional regulator n=1 Tax=Granulosicoccus sp. 3-233 TaxID=3417969 RepID=UPI003D338485